jgi:hypothetical protein
MQAKLLTSFLIAGFCIASSAALAQDTAPAPPPDRVKLPPRVVAVGGNWQCGTPAVVHLSVFGGSAGTQGRVIVSGTELKFGVARSVTKDFTVTTSLTTCPNIHPLVLDVTLTNGSATIHQLKYIDAATVMLR